MWIVCILTKIGKQTNTLGVPIENIQYYTYVHVVLWNDDKPQAYEWPKRTGKEVGSGGGEGVHPQNTHGISDQMIIFTCNLYNFTKMRLSQLVIINTN